VTPVTALAFTAVNPAYPLRSVPPFGRPRWLPSQLTIPAIPFAQSRRPATAAHHLPSWLFPISLSLRLAPRPPSLIAFAA